MTWIVWLLFLLSGACGLIYEVLWSRQLGLVLGHSVHSLAAVLSAFMAGLALGSFLAGRYLVKFRRLLALYGMLEILIGAYCLALPWLFEAAIPLYTRLYGETGGTALTVARFAICFLLLMIPTTCMGATLPILSQFLVRSPAGLARTAGTLYAVNTFGAVMGAAGAGFFLLPILGLSSTNHLAVAINLALGVASLMLGRRESAPADETPEPAPDPAAPAPAEPPSPRAVRFAALTFGLTGFAAMATQIAWTRALTLCLGSSTYAFSLIVALFILGLALGGTWGARRAARLDDPIAELSRVLLLIGLQAMTLVPILGFAPILFFWLMAVGSQWGFAALLAAEALGVTLLLILPTFLMGSTLPLTLQIVRHAGRDAGRTVGGLYALNTLGSILGSLAGGFVLLPLLQLEGTLKLAALLYALPGAALFLHAPSYADRRKQLVSGVLLGATLLLIFAPRWDPRRMSAGAFLLRQPDKVEAAREGRFLDALPGLTGDRLLFYREGASATVAVYETPDGLTMAIGGKPDASSHGDMSTQVGLTMVPMLLHDGVPEEILVIGMGSGVSLGAALAPEAVRRVDLVELAPEVIEAAQAFEPYSKLRYKIDGRLDEPKLDVILEDGRSHLQLTSRRYDVIASEPSNPWIAGIGNLFTRESFELCRRALKPKGIMAQWLHRYGLGEREFASVVRTFMEVFPHTQVWCVLPGQDYLLVGSETPLHAELAQWIPRSRDPGAQAYLRKVGFHGADEFFACFMADRARLEQVLAPAPLHTDDNLLLEFAAPRTMHAGSSQFPIAGWRVHPARMLGTGEMPPDYADGEWVGIDCAVNARMLVDYGQDFTGDRAAILEAAAKLAPNQYWTIYQRLRAMRQVAKQPTQALDIRAAPDHAITILERERQKLGALPQERADKLALAYATRAVQACERGEREPAAADLAAAEALAPESYEVALARSAFARVQGRTDAALDFAKRALERGAPRHRAAEAAVRALLDAKLWVAARQELDTLRHLPDAADRPEWARVWMLRAELMVEQEDRQEAGFALGMAERLAPNDPVVLAQRVTLLQRLGGLPNFERAAETLERLLAYEPSNPARWLDRATLEGKLAGILFSLGRTEEARERALRSRAAAHTSLAFDPDAGEPFVWAAQAWLILGESGPAQRAAEAARAQGVSDEDLPEEVRKKPAAETPQPPPAP
ncbi:MAG: fused MFS/spermidine synthase [Planctomycetes bacterium]|nr:fused MFS/spermidine synthase [Planctomycetota bacterium]